MASSVLIVLLVTAPLSVGPATAATGATLRSFSVLPHQPAIGGLVRLQLDVVNDSGAPWAAQDLVHMRWLRPDGLTAQEDSRPLGQPVGQNADIALTLVTLAPAEVGSFSLAVELLTRPHALSLVDAIPFHLSGFLFLGRGNGHGLGMSQWGARGRAAAGEDYRTILAAYYQGAVLDTRDTSGTVRVALTHGPLNLARAWPRLFGGFPEIAGPVTVDGTPLTAGSGELLEFGAAGGHAVAFVVGVDGSQRGASVPITQTLVVHGGSPAGIRTNLLETLDSDFRSGSDQRRYAGTLLIIPKGGTLIRPVNVLPFEEYLKGVVPAEMPVSWGAEALKAQAIAARTYALRKILLGGQGDYDLEGNEYDQAYSGLSQQRSASSGAVDATRGQVLTFGGHLIQALYMASDGGHTENSEYGFIRWDHGLVPAVTLAYLRGVADPLDAAPAWRVGPFSPALAAALLRDGGEDLGSGLDAIDVLQKGPSGRILGVRLVGSSQSDEISGPYLRYLFGLPDTLVQIVGGT